MSRNSNIGDAIQDVISEAVESAINDMDFSDKVRDELPDLDDLVEKAVDNLDIDDKVSEAVNDAIENYDFSDAVEKEVEKELQANLSECVSNELDEFFKTNKFNGLIELWVNQILDERAAAAKLVAYAKRAKVMDYVKCGPLVRWVKVKWAGWK